MAEVNEIVYVPVPGYGEWQLYATREGNLYRRRSYKNGTEKYVKIGSKYVMDIFIFAYKTIMPDYKRTLTLSLRERLLIILKINRVLIILTETKSIIVLKIYGGQRLVRMHKTRKNLEVHQSIRV